MGTEKLSPKGPASDADPTDAEPASPGRAGWFWRLFAHQWLLMVVLLATIAIQGTAFLYHRATERTPGAPPSGEIDLGSFHFEADKREGGPTLRADFSLHVALLESAEALARQRLAARKFRVQQDVEELLRKAHGGDFDDPGLQDLKRQLLEQINQTLGVRAVSDVIVTSLTLQRASSAKPAVASTADLAE
jgi:flagellar basal body-associated protein FliL